MGSLAIARLSVLETMRRKEFYVVLVLVIGLAVWLQVADLGASGAGRFAKHIVMQVAWLASFGLAAPLAARQIPQDVEQRTVYILLARPVPRWHYVLGRALGAAATASLCLIGLFLVLAIMLVMKGGASLADATLWQAFALQLAALGLLCALSVFFSSFSSPSAAVTFSLMLLAVMRYGGMSLAQTIEKGSGLGTQAAWGIYLLLPHFEFFSATQRFVHGWGPLPNTVFFGFLTYGMVYSLALIAGASIIFRRKWL